MKFGSVPLADAEGAILAHSVGLPGGRLRKGRRLTSEDIRALEAAGLSEVIAAQLGPEDVHENDAANALAAAFVPNPKVQHLKVTAPFTGRVNVLADGPGVVRLDAEAVRAVNAVHPMITIATVPDYQQMGDGGMVATIKIIAYGVPEAELARACALAQEGLRLAPPVVRSVRLIVTDIQGGPGDKGWRAIADRVAAFGLDLPPPEVVPHHEDDLSAALSAGTSDLTLILTGSATSDIEDVAPVAVRRTGGQINRFGMPVDPGNLLFVGQMHGGSVIGLPGCARAPALNGADWVLARLICGLEVSDSDIAGMGVGGLLKEIPSRPQPRRGRRTDAG